MPRASTPSIRRPSATPYPATISTSSRNCISRPQIPCRATRSTGGWRDSRVAACGLLGFEVGRELHVAPLDGELTAALGVSQSNRHLFGRRTQLTLRERCSVEVLRGIVVRAPLPVLTVEDQLPAIASLAARPHAVFPFGDGGVAENQVRCGRERGRLIGP